MIGTVGILGARLNAQFEFPKGIQLEAYRDALGYWTGPGGIRFKRDGTPVTAGDQWKPDEALRDYAITLQEYANDVKALLTMPASQNQFDALVLLCWNIGIEAFRASSALRFHNEGRFEDAAEAFTLWLWGTARRGEDGPEIADGPSGWQPGQPIPKGVHWKQALRGLYRRHCAEALLYLGLDWSEACASENVKMRTTTLWQPDRNRWKDRVDFVTPWLQILARAKPLAPVSERGYPVPFDDDDIQIPDPGVNRKTPRPAPKPVEAVEADPMEPKVTRTIEIPADWDQMSEKEQTEFLNKDSLRQARAGTMRLPGPVLEAVVKPDVPPVAVREEVKIVKAAPPRAIPVEQVRYLDSKDKTPGNITVKPIQDSQRGKGFAKAETAKTVGTVAVAGMVAEQLGAMRPIIEFAEKYSWNVIAIVFVLMIVIAFVLYQYGKWQREKGEKEAEDLLG